MERFLENAMYTSRWLLAPVYFGLSLGLVALTIKFFQEIVHVLPHIFSVSESELILTLLSLVPSHHNHAIGEKIGIRLDADHVIAFKHQHA